VVDSDFNVLGPERSEIHVFEHRRLFRRLRNPCIVVHEVSSPEGWAERRTSASGLGRQTSVPLPRERSFI
jgi:hypothetical protein